MQRFVPLVAVLLFLLPALSTQAADCPVGFEAMERLELLPLLLPNGTQTRQFITYDPAGKNRSGFFKRYEENGEYVFFDDFGPGCLCRQQMNVFSKHTKFPSAEIRIRYYFDDEPKPRIDMPFAEFFGKGGKYTAPFTPPLAFFDERGTQWSGGPGAFAVLYYPLAFQKRLKITAYHPAGMKSYGATWFQYTYLKYPPNTPVETWKGRTIDSPAVRQQLERMGDNPHKFMEGKSYRNTLVLAPGEKKIALELTGQGAIMSLRLKVEPWSPDTFFHTRLRITWDDQATPAIDMPIASFFGAGGDTIGVEDVSRKSLTTLLFGFDGKAGRCWSYWPMPYWSRARIEVINEGKTPISPLEIETASAPPQSIPYRRNANGYFAAKRTVDISSDGAVFSKALDIRGRGKIVGLTMFSHGYNMDGDEFTFIDGSQTPQIHGDGTEDDHNQGWGGYAIQKPYWGGLVNGFQGGYRLYLAEPYVFNSSILIAYEHSRCGGTPDRGQKTDFTTWYYFDKPGAGNLKLTDELDVGKPASEKAHQYSVSGEKWFGTTSSSYDLMEFAPAGPTTTDDGRAFTGASQFTVKIDPANEGVRLRRRLNRHRSNVQRSDVFVDGRKMTDVPWYVCDLPVTPDTAFRDTDFEIPASYTRGKDRLTIRLEHVAGQAENCTNEYYYWVYCYGANPR